MKIQVEQMDKGHSDKEASGHSLFGHQYSGYNSGIYGNRGSLSPYLNIDPSVIIQGSQSEYIFPEGATQRRGRLELAFSQIGGCVFGCAMFGGMNGLVTGYRELQSSQYTAAVRRTQMLNSVTKRGASMAQTLGVIALMYSVLGVVLAKLRGAEDELNTLVAGTSTGMLYKSTAGMKKCFLSGGVGFGLASAYCLYTSKDRLKQIVGL